MASIIAPASSSSVAAERCEAPCRWRRRRQERDLRAEQEAVALLHQIERLHAARVAGGQEVAGAKVQGDEGVHADQARHRGRPPYLQRAGQHLGIAAGAKDGAQRSSPRRSASWLSISPLNESSTRPSAETMGWRPLSASTIRRRRVRTAAPGQGDVTGSVAPPRCAMSGVLRATRASASLQPTATATRTFSGFGAWGSAGAGSTRRTS